MYYPKMSEDTFSLGTAHFVIVFFQISAQVIDCRYSLESLHWAFRQFLHLEEQVQAVKATVNPTYSLFPISAQNKILGMY